MFWPAMNAARKIRKENIALRLLEASLNGVTTAELARAVLNLAAGILDDKLSKEAAALRPAKPASRSVEKTKVKATPDEARSGETESAQA